MNKESRFFISIYRINIILLERLEIRILALEDKIRIPAREFEFWSRVEGRGYKVEGRG